MNTDTLYNYTGLEIAVTGVSCRFPDADSAAVYWENIVNGKESIRFFSEEEIRASGVSEDQLKQPGFVKSNGALLDNKYDFDPEFFGYSLDEAVLLDPQIRILHECVHAALEDAGYVPGQEGSKVGLYAGASTGTLWEVLSGFSESSAKVGAWSRSHLVRKDYIASLIAYKLRLTGPAVVVNTACSTSLVAIHLAARAILLGECDMAVAGASSLMMISKKGYLYEEGLIKSPDGHCRAFDKAAMGTAAGEGTGVVVLKSLKKALEDKDHIYAVIKGSAINNDGARKVGYNAPSIKGQVEVIKEALHFSGVKPDTIGYVEAHGTGTQIGDPVELKALHMAYEGAGRQQCAIGSVKPNIGHLDTAAGIAGFIKAVMALYHKQLPPAINFTTPNPQYDFDNSPFYVNTTARTWENGVHPRRAAVSSFGIGGTNAHVILEEAPQRTASLTQDDEPLLMLLSAKNEASLQQVQQDFYDYLLANPKVNLPDLAYTLQTGRENFAYKKYLLFTGYNELLEGIAKNKFSEMAPAPPREACFVFPGQGAQYAEMGAGLYKAYPVFRKELDTCFDILKGLTGKDFKEMVFSGKENTELSLQLTMHTQPVLFAWQYALARLLMSWGITPVSMIGHSVGEYVCACIAGLFTLKQGLELVVKRGNYMQQMQPGGMIGVNMPWTALMKILPDGMTISAVNSPDHCVAGGPQEAMGNIREVLSEKGIHATVLTTSHAFHSPMMETAANHMVTAFEDIHFGEINIPYVSNLNGEWVTASQVKQPAYWGRHLRHAVQLEKGLNTILENEQLTLIVFGPEGAFEGFVKNNTNYRGQPVVSLLRHPKNKTTTDQHFLVDKIGQLWLSGIKLKWDAYYAGAVRSKLALPTYHFKRRTFALDPAIIHQLFSGHFKGWGEVKKAAEDWCLLPTWKRGYPAATDTAREIGSWLVIGHGDLLQQQLLQQLRTNQTSVISLVWGNNTVKINAAEYQVNKEEVTDIAAIMEAHGQPGTLKVIDLTFMRRNSENSISSLTHLLLTTNALQQLETAADIEWKVVTDQLLVVNGEEKGMWELSAISGALKVIPQEILHITTQQIDVTSEVAPEVLCWQIIREALHPVIEPTVALRNGFRWLPVFEPQQALPVSDWRVFKPGEVIVITGGLGRIGFLMAQYFASLGCKLWLIGKTDLSQPDPTPEIQRKQQQLHKLQAITSGVTYMAADVREAAQLEAAISKCEEVYGPVTGIIHAAAVIDRPSTKCLIKDLSSAILQEQFTPQLAPLLHLHELSQSREIAFIIITSSLASVLGGIGYFGYAAANACLDGWINHLKGAGHTRWLSVNWDAWNVSEDPDELKGKLAIIHQEGPRVLHSMLSSFTQGGQVLVSTHDFERRWNKWVKLGFRQQEKQVGVSEKALSRPYQRASMEAPVSAIEEQLVTLWKEVFGYEEIGTKDDFFELGGDSLKALGLLNKIRVTYAKVISLEDFFQRPRIADIALLLEMKTAQLTAIPPADKKPYYIASPSQRSQYFIQHLHAESTLYNQTSVYEVKGQLDIAKLSAAFYELIKRHEVLRTALRLSGETIVQQIPEEFEPVIRHVQVQDQQEADAVLKNFVKPFSLSQPPLIRLGIISTTPAVHLVILDMHHIVTDGITHIILMNDLFKIYYGVVLPDLSIQYKDYAEWLNTPQQQQRLAEQQTFWKEQLSGELPRIALPLDYPRPNSNSNKGGFLQFDGGSERMAQIRAMGSRSNVTPFMIVLSAFNILLSKLSGLQDILIGTPIAGRNYPELKQVAGMFVNTVVLRNHPAPDISYNHFLQQVKQTVLKAFDHQELPFDDLVALIGTDRELNHHPVFDIFISYESFDTKDYVTIENGYDDLEIIPKKFEHATARFDLTLYCREYGEDLTFGFEYNTDLFSPATIGMLSDYFMHILEQLLATPDMLLSDIRLLTPAAEEQVIRTFNDTAVPYPADATIISLFEKQVSQSPDKIAIVYEDAFLTFSELDRKCNQLANYLTDLGIGEESLVGICVERSLEMMIGILAILKAGGAYVPIDPKYPAERISYMLSDTKATVVLSSNDCLAFLPEMIAHIVNLDEPEVYALYPDVPPAVSILPSHLAYIVYTSGTTGQPKGVMNEHRGIVNRLLWTQDYFKFDEQDAVLQKTFFCFDVSVWELCCPLIIGLRLVFAKPEGHLDVDYLKEVITKQGITTIHFGPAMLQFFLENIENGDCSGLLRVFCSGEALLPQHIQGFHAKLPAASLYNLYGPTEAAVDVSCWQVPIQKKEIKTIPIGKPIANTQLYILDNEGAPTPIGGMGELYIGGTQVARGYLNKPDLTAARFIPDPFSKVPGARLYKTGDLCRWLPDGTIVYLGRIDDQVKIRGYRIELGEVEHALQQLPEVRQAVVLATSDNAGNPQLVGYVVLNGGVAFSAEGIRSGLQAKLPDHMLPSLLVEIPSVPITGNGKVDKKKLKELNIPVHSSDNYVAPANIIEQTLANIWQQLLGVPRVGVHDSFFELGGHSLLGMRMIAHVRKYFSLDITVHTIFEFKTIHYLGKFIALQLKVAEQQEGAVEMDEIDI